jgi:hypothetical protein
MRRNAVAALMIGVLGGCTSFQSGPETGGGASVPHWGRSYGPPTVPGVKGPYGEGVAMAPPYDSTPPGNAYAAQQMMRNSVPLGAVQMTNPGAMPGTLPGMMPNTMVPRGPMLSPPGVPFAPGAPAGPNVPGSSGAPMMPGMLPGMPPGAPRGALPGMPPGMLPPGMFPGSGVQTAGGFVPANMPTAGGVINANIAPGGMPPGGIMQTQMALANPAAGIRFLGQRTQIRFIRPSGMKVSWFTQGPDGKPAFSTTPIEAPGRYNFPQAAIYRLKLSNVEGRPGLEVYPTMEVVPSNPKTEAFLAHSAVPIEFTNEDFKQIADGNYVVKVIYLPDPQFQDVAGTGTDEILSTRLDPGADPIQEALRRGSILVVLRMGNVDQEAPNTPPLNAPGPNVNPPIMPAPGAMPPQGFQVPFWGMKPGPITAPPDYPGTPALPPGMNGPGNPFGTAAPTPGPLSVPSVPLPGNNNVTVPVAPVSPPVSAVPKPIPSAVESSNPKGSPPVVPGSPSTDRSQDISPAPPIVPPVVDPSGTPTTPPVVTAPPIVPVPADAPPPPLPPPQSNGPVFPPTPGVVQPPVAPVAPQGPVLSTVPSVSRVQATP